MYDWITSLSAEINSIVNQLYFNKINYKTNKSVSYKGAKNISVEYPKAEWGNTDGRSKLKREVYGLNCVPQTHMLKS